MTAAGIRASLVGAEEGLGLTQGQIGLCACHPPDQPLLQGRRAWSLPPQGRAEHPRGDPAVSQEAMSVLRAASNACTHPHVSVMPLTELHLELTFLTAISKQPNTGKPASRSCVPCRSRQELVPLSCWVLASYTRRLLALRCCHPAEETGKHRLDATLSA